MSFNEILANPGGLDANCDGIVSTTEDEFVELINISVKPVTLDGAILGDTITDHHVFPKGTTVEPGGALVVFSGGTPTFDQMLPDRGGHCVPMPESVIMQVASSGRLGLINGGETLYLTEAKSLLTATYGSLDLSAESYNREPDMALKGWSPHRSVKDALSSLSPGTRVDGTGFDGSPAYTESDTGTTSSTPTTTDTGAGDTGEPAPLIDLASLLINEIHADAVVDANCDGLPSFIEDEFIEIVVTGTEGLDLDGVRLTDDTAIRHTFEPMWVNPGEAVLVFGGGTPDFGSEEETWCDDLPDSVHVVVASTGTLALGDRGDTITLVDPTGTLSIDTPWDASAPSDQSIVRIVEFTDSEFVGHLSVSDAPVSPGTQSGGGGLDEPVPTPDTGSADTASDDTGAVDTASEDTGTVDTAAPPSVYDTSAFVSEPVVVNEFLADPDLVAGDANCDGIIDPYDDEFIEIVNRGEEAIDLTGVTLSDSYSVRHVIGSVTLMKNQVLVVFGGGTPLLDGSSASSDSHCRDVTSWAFIETATTGGLALSNTGDDITVTHPSGVVLTSLSYGDEASMNESVVRIPELSDESFVGHTTVVSTLFSPGTRVNGTPFDAVPALDTGVVIDTGAPIDTGEIVDTGAPIDTGEIVDTGTPIDTGVVTATPDVMLNELLASAAEDANCDVRVDEDHDSFMEFVNRGEGPVDLEDWSISVDGMTRHTFSAITLSPGGAVVVFGGGTPLFDGSGPSLGHCVDLPPSVVVVTASSGSLSLIDRGSTIQLSDASGDLAHSYTYGDEASEDVSLVRNPELSDSPMVLHTLLDSSASFSPGTLAGGASF